MDFSTSRDTVPKSKSWESRNPTRNSFPGCRKYGFDKAILFPDLEEMIAKVHPQAVLVYTNTYDHRGVVEICARHGVHVMMEKPLAVSLDDALAIQKAAQLARFMCW